MLVGDQYTFLNYFQNGKVEIATNMHNLYIFKRKYNSYRYNKGNHGGTISSGSL